MGVEAVVQIGTELGGPNFQTKLPILSTPGLEFLEFIIAASMVRESGGWERFQFQTTCSVYPLSNLLAKNFLFFFGKNARPMISKKLQNVIGNRAMDKILVHILGLKNDPCRNSHTCKGLYSKQRDLGKFASPSYCLFGVVFKFGVFLRETIRFI